MSGLAAELVQLHSAHPDHIELNVDAVDMVLHIERAVPLGLIANELLLNSIKHGLNGRPGRLAINLQLRPTPVDAQTEHPANGVWAELRVVDTGPGLPAGFDPAGVTSMGMRLIGMLVRQLKRQAGGRSRAGRQLLSAFPARQRELSEGGPAWIGES